MSEQVPILKKRASIEKYHLLRERNTRKNKQQARVARLSKGLLPSKHRGPKDTRLIKKSLQWLAYRGKREVQNEKRAWKSTQRQQRKLEQATENQKKKEKKSKKEEGQKKRKRSAEKQPSAKKAKKNAPLQPFTTQVRLVTRVHGADDLIPTKVEAIFNKYNLKSKDHSVLVEETPQVHADFVVAQKYLRSDTLTPTKLTDMLKTSGWVTHQKVRKPLTSNLMIEKMFGQFDALCVEDMADQLLKGGDTFQQINKALHPFHVAREHKELDVSMATEVKMKASRDPANKTRFGKALRGIQQHNVQNKKVEKVKQKSVFKVHGMHGNPMKKKPKMDAQKLQQPVTKKQKKKPTTDSQATEAPAEENQ